MILYVRYKYINPFRYRGYYFDSSIGLYYLNSRYYDAELGRFINADNIGELDPETINGLNLYAFCGNNPIMRTEPLGNAWWKWLLSGVLLVVGVALCATGVGVALGAGLIAAGASMMAFNIMDAAGVDSKIASIISSGLNIVAGIILCATGIGGALGGSLIGSGIGGLIGGFAAEAMGFSFTTGAIIGGIVGGIVGGKIHEGIRFSNIAKQGVVIGKSGQYSEYAKEVGMNSYKGMPGYKAINKVSPSLASKMGWANNQYYLNQVMKHGGVIVDIGGPLTGSYGKEVALVEGYKYLVKLAQLIF